MKKAFFVFLAVFSVILFSCEKVKDPVNPDNSNSGSENIQSSANPSDPSFENENKLKIMQDSCEGLGGKSETWQEGGELEEVCFFDDESFCYLQELNEGKCKKGDMKYYDEYPQEIKLNEVETEKLSYALQGIILDIINQKPDTKLVPLETDEQKALFVYNILNDNYANKYVYTEEFLLYNSESEGTPIEDLDLESSSSGQQLSFPVLENEEIELIDPNCGEDGVTILGKSMPYQMAYKKSDIDKILNDLVGNTITNAKNITKNGLVLQDNKYLFFNYTNYDSDNILSRGRATQLTIDKITQVDQKNVEIEATYLDDLLEGECKISYKGEVSNGFYPYKFSEYSFTGCKTTKNSYLHPTFPYQLIYGINETLSSNSVLTYEGQFEQKDIDLDGDGNPEIFGIGRDYPNGVALFGRKGDTGTNFLLDFDKKFLDEWDELKDGLFSEMYFEDLDGDGKMEVLAAIGDKTKNLEVNIYKITDSGLENIGKIIGKSYLKFDEYNKLIYAPYADNGFCKVYGVNDGNVMEIVFVL